jgi:hypothetical protein
MNAMKKNEQAADGQEQGEVAVRKGHTTAKAITAPKLGGTGGGITRNDTGPGTAGDKNGRTGN